MKEKLLTKVLCSPGQISFASSAVAASSETASAVRRHLRAAPMTCFRFLRNRFEKLRGSE